jgi:hypothetical protein
MLIWIEKHHVFNMRQLVKGRLELYLFSPWVANLEVYLGLVKEIQTEVSSVIKGKLDAIWF